MKKSSKNVIYIIGVIMIIIATCYIIVMLTHDSTELTSEDIRVINELNDIEESVLGGATDITQLKDNLSKQECYVVKYECSNKENTTKSIIEVDKDITHVIADYGLDVYIDEENNVTYTNREGKWIKSEGTYTSELKDIGIEAINEIKSIGINDLPSEEVGIDTENKSANLRYDKDTDLPLEITIEEQNVTKNYKFDYNIEEDIKIPEEVVNSAELTDNK